MNEDKVDIRTPESHQREEASKVAANAVLERSGFVLKRVSTTRNRHLIHCTDSAGIDRVLWLKVGWSPGHHGTSAVQILMLKKSPALGKPTTWSTDAVLSAVREKMDRAVADGATDMLLFSLDALNTEPIAALIVPIPSALGAFKESLDSNEVEARKGASPSLWLFGDTEPRRRLAAIVRRHAQFDLLSWRTSGSVDGGDALADLTPISDEHGHEVPDKLTRLVGTFRRDAKVRQRVLARAAGLCEYCGLPTFAGRDGRPYLEAHHVLALSAAGPDTEANVIALCPLHHRQAHYGADWEQLAEQMIAIARSKVESHRP